MITEKIVYVTEDGSEFGSKESAEHHLKFKKFKKDLIVLPPMGNPFNIFSTSFFVDRYLSSVLSFLK